MERPANRGSVMNVSILTTLRCAVPRRSLPAAFLLWAVLVLVCRQTPATVVSVNAGTNGTTGWTFANTSGDSGQNGSFTGTVPNIPGLGTSWGLYANSGQTASQTYSFASALNTALGQSVLPVGGTVQIDLSVGFINSGGVVGIALQNATGVNRFETYYIGASATDQFQLNDAGGVEFITGPNTSFSASTWTGGAYQTILFTQLAGNQYALSFDGVSATNNNLSIAASDISQIRFFNFNAGSGSGNNQYANNLVVVPEPPVMPGLIGGVACLAVRRLRRRGV